MRFRNSGVLLKKLILIIALLLSFSSKNMASRPYNPFIEDPLLEKWRWIKYNELSSKGIRCMTEGDAGVMWFGLDHGVISYNGSEWQEYNKDNGFSNGAVRSLCYSENGILYAGSDSGIYRFDQRQWQCLFSADNLAGFVVNTIIETGENSIFCGTNIGLIWINKHQMMTQSLETLVKQTGKEQNKNISLDFSNFKIERLPHEERFFIKELMVQLIRNSIAHGIENAKERKKLKKPPESVITISTFADDKTYGFCVRDDGRGIQLNKLKQKAIQSKKWNKEEIAKWSNQDLADLIFEQGISTTENTDMISGRGVGLDLVRERVHSRNGSIKVDFKPGMFCEFRLVFPKKA